MSAIENLAFGPFVLAGTPPALRCGTAALALDAGALALLAAVVRAPDGVGAAQLWPLVSAASEVDVDRLCAIAGDINDALGAHSGDWYLAWYPDAAQARFALVDGERARTPAAPLPARRSDIVGRDAAIAEVVARLRSHRFVTVVAAGGMGKTTVALAAAHAAAADHPDGVHVVDLAPIVDPDRLAQRVAAAVGCRGDGADALALLQQWAQHRHALVVLDSCEHVIDAAAGVAEALGGAGSSVAVLATSREPLRARGEWLYRLAPLGLPQAGATVSAAQALAFPALRLFVERASAVDPAFRLDDADMPRLVALCSRLDGIALAIEIVAARVDTLGFAALAGQLESVLLHLPARRCSAPARHSTVAALLDWSYRLLSPLERRVLRRLSVFRDGFDGATAGAVVADDATSADAVQEALLDLVAKSLVAPGHGGDPERRRLLDTTRAYAAARLDEAGERDATSRRHARWLAGVLAQADTAWNHLDRRQWLARHAPLIDDIRAALDWAFARGGDVVLGVELTIASFPVGRQMLLVDEFTQRVRRAMDALAAQGDDTPAAAATRRRLTFLIACLGVGVGIPLAPQQEAVITSAIDGQAPLERFVGLNAMWGMAVFRGDFRDGAAWADRMEQLATTMADPVAQLVAGRIQAQMLQFGGHHARACEKARRVLAQSWRTIALRYNPSPVEPRVSMRVTLARALWMQGRPDSAAAMAREAMEQARTDSPLAQCQAIVMAALVIALWSGRDRSAGTLADQLLELEPQLAFSHWLRWIRGLRRIVALRAGAAPTATATATATAIAIADADADADGFDEPEPVLADHLATLDECWLTPRCIARVESGLVGWCAPEVLRLQGERALRERGADAAARGADFLLRSLAVARAQEAAAWELRSATSLARHWQARDRAGAARAVLEPVIARLTEGHATQDWRAARALLESL